MTDQHQQIGTVMYILKIRKSDLPLLTILNHGVTPKIEKKTTYLLIVPGGHNEIITEREFIDMPNSISKNSPILFKMNKA